LASEAGAKSTPVTRAPRRASAIVSKPVALDVHDVASAQIRGDLGHGGRFGAPHVEATGDQARGVIDGILAVDRGQGIPARTIELEMVVGDDAMLGARPMTSGSKRLVVGICLRDTGDARPVAGE
jgi:hypothetical protein